MAENTARPARPTGAVPAQTSSATASQAGSATVAQTNGTTPAQTSSATAGQTGGATPAMAQLKYDDKGLVPAIVQQYNTGEVLMLAYMNEGSLKLSQDTKTTWFWSRSRGMLWHKGATSGHVQHIKEIRYDCDADCLLVLVDAEGPACHTGARSCFYRRLEKA